MIRVEGLVKTFERNGVKTEALRGVDLQVDEGEIYGIIGLSGAGKSSLVRCICSLEKPSGGNIYINGRNITEMSGEELRQTQRKTGLIFQHFNLLMNSTVYDNIAFPLRLSKVGEKEIGERVQSLLEIVGLTDKRDAYPGMLSGGQKQRVGIARALANEPDILICDEATSALDPATTKSILELLKRINRELQITMLVITHEMSIVKELCHKVAIIEEGLIIEEGRVVDIFVSPQTETAKSFFADSFSLDSVAYRSIMSSGRCILKLNFIGDSAATPHISNAIKRFDVSASVIAGNIQDVSDTIVGTLIISMDGEDQNIKKALDYFRAEGIHLEVIKNGLHK